MLELTTPSTVHKSKAPTADVALMLQSLPSVALHSPIREQIKPARLPVMPAVLDLMLLRSWEHVRSLLVAGVSFQYCLQASNTRSPIWNLSDRVLVAATMGCMTCTHASHFRQGVSSTTSSVCVGRGWQVLRVLQESDPALHVQTSAVMFGEQTLSEVQLALLKHVPGCGPAAVSKAVLG